MRTQASSGRKPVAVSPLRAKQQMSARHLADKEAAGYVAGLLPNEDDHAPLEEHLWNCRSCRDRIARLLDLNGSASPRALAFLERVNRFQRLSAAGAATEDVVRARLREHGGKLVYERDGQLIEELPDGTTRPLASAEGGPLERSGR